MRFLRRILIVWLSCSEGDLWAGGVSACRSVDTPIHQKITFFGVSSPQIAFSSITGNEWPFSVPKYTKSRHIWARFRGLNEVMLECWRSYRSINDTVFSILFLGCVQDALDAWKMTDLLASVAFKMLLMPRTQWLIAYHPRSKTEDHLMPWQSTVIATEYEMTKERIHHDWLLRFVSPRFICWERRDWPFVAREQHIPRHLSLYIHARQSTLCCESVTLEHGSILTDRRDRVHVSSDTDSQRKGYCRNGIDNKPYWLHARIHPETVPVPLHSELNGKPCAHVVANKAGHEIDADDKYP